MESVTESDISRIYRAAQEQNLLEEDDTVAIFLDLSVIDDRLRRLRSAFPDNTLHAIAVKTNPITFILDYIVSSGFGLEAATMGEVELALNSGIENHRLVFDSPAKTKSEIRYLEQRVQGVRVNADSLEELSRYSNSGTNIRLGVRINPLVDSNSMESMNVGSVDSKFGVPISQSGELLTMCLELASVDCLHLHTGSQYLDFKPIVLAVRKVLDLANKVNEQAGFRKITHIDIGGGFPVNYSGGNPYLIEDYADALLDECKELFDGTFSLITEFGRYVHANAGWAAIKIEYVKSTTEGSTLITHAGADMFVRESYNRDDWYHRYFILNGQGNVKDANPVSTDLAGPLCFGGDFYAKGIVLPTAEPEDVVIANDIGANTFALWSRHCSRPFPKVLAYRGDSSNTTIQVVKDRETYQDIIRFWS